MVKEYLPIQEQLEMLSNVINVANENSKYYNPAQLSVLLYLEIIYHATNLSFTEKQKEDFTKTYDLIVESGLGAAIFMAIPRDMVSQLRCWLDECVKSIYDYSSSARGVLESLRSEYNNMDMNIEDLQKKIEDPETLALFKQVAGQLG